MTKIFSKTREGAKVYSREADYLEYRQDSDPLIANTNDIGSVSTDQLELGVEYPTIQGAIQDLKTVAVGNIGDVKINTTGNMPGAVSQVGSVQFTGSVNIINTNYDPENPVELKQIITILGVPVEIIQGETADQVAVKFVAAAQEYETKGIVFTQIQQSSSDPTVVEFVHADYRVHSYTDFLKYGLTATFTVSSPPQNGQGSWVLLGQESKTFTGATDPVTLYYYKRYA
ncbi:baseplate wedge subunit [Erwinia phage Cronus]|uniref:Baseplate wedge protein n=1 Tax=Erwinia phage Cronus TaxID=2163633 RepID=A0A2S1GLN9_9CAUD|nr:baseplate wedge subunit [Erwinia phage Cronus]AWD90307.1 baseplate wedge protein [Erwinia phage Cronus]